MTTTPIGNLDGSSLRFASTTAITKESPLPGMARAGKQSIMDPKKQRIRYQSFDLRDNVDIAELERIETKAWRDEGIYIIDKKNYVFMDRMFFLVQYVEDSE
jgi:hypothetical protein